MTYFNLSEEFEDVIGVPALKCYVEYADNHWLNKDKYRSKILAWLQKNYGCVILPFYYKNKEVVLLKSYS